MAETVAIGVASRTTQRTPARFTAVNNTTMKMARGVTGTPGRYQEWIAVADRMAVNPQVGTQPHQ